MITPRYLKEYDHSIGVFLIMSFEFFLVDLLEKMTAEDFVGFNVILH